MSSKAKTQPKREPLKLTPFNSKNPLHIPELEGLLKIARSDKYKITQSAKLLAFVAISLWIALAELSRLYAEDSARE